MATGEQIAEAMNMMQPVIGFGFHSSSLEEVNHDVLWLALLNEVRQPGAHAPTCSVIDCDGYVERKLPSIGSTQHIYVSRKSGRLFIEMSLMEKRAKLKWNPSALKHPQIRGVSSD